jgi:hypothetical protein
MFEELTVKQKNDKLGDICERITQEYYRKQGIIVTRSDDKFDETCDMRTIDGRLIEVKGQLIWRKYNNEEGCFTIKDTYTQRLKASTVDDLIFISVENKEYEHPTQNRIYRFNYPKEQFNGKVGTHVIDGVKKMLFRVSDCTLLDEITDKELINQMKELATGRQYA